MKFSEVSIRKIIEICGGKTPPGAVDAWLDASIAGVVTDTRDDVAGKLFVPLTGERFDGHDFMAAALQKGAAACLAERGRYTGERVIEVGSSLAALHAIAAYYKSLFNVKTIAVTGSSGKTTTKELAASVLGQKYRTLKTEGNLNNEIGVPKMIFRLDEAHELAVLEMGMNHFGEIHRLTMTAKPDIAIITNIGLAHVENLGDRDGILRAKTEIFDGMASDAPTILNGGDEYLRKLEGTRENIVWYGLGGKNDFTATDTRSLGINGVACRMLSPKYDLDIEVTIPSPGAHMVMNALAAAAAGCLLGLTAREIKRGVESFTPCENRMDITEIPERGLVVINDAYNANPGSMKAALDVLAAYEGRKTAILGDMLELGGMSAALHYEIGAYAAEKGVDELIAIGEASLHTCDGFASRKGGGHKTAHYPDAESFINEGNAKEISGAVLVKASRDMGLKRIAQKLNHPGVSPALKCVPPARSAPSEGGELKEGQI